MSASAEGGLPGAVADYACAVLGSRAERIIGVVRFADGNRHAVYRVSYLDARGAKRDVVVRVSHGSAAADRAQAEREAAALRAVAGVAGPVLYDMRLTSQWFQTPAMCLQFLPGDQTALNATSLSQTARLASIVARLHTRDADGLVPPLDPPGTIASYARGRLRSIASTLSWARDPLPAAMQAHLKDAMGQLAASLSALQDLDCFRVDEPLRLLHGDIAPGNVIWGQDPVLIDWEYTRLGDPGDEIAYVFDQNALGEPQRQAFWKGYRQAVPADVRLDALLERVTWWEPMTLVGSTLWWVERWIRRTELDAGGAADDEVARDASYYFEQIARRLSRLEKLMASDR